MPQSRSGDLGHILALPSETLSRSLNLSGEPRCQQLSMEMPPWGWYEDHMQWWIWKCHIHWRRHSIVLSAHSFQFREALNSHLQLWRAVPMFLLWTSCGSSEGLCKSLALGRVNRAQWWIVRVLETSCPGSSAIHKLCDLSWTSKNASVAVLTCKWRQQCHLHRNVGKIKWVTYLKYPAHSYIKGMAAMAIIS